MQPLTLIQNYRDSREQLVNQWIGEQIVIQHSNSLHVVVQEVLVTLQDI